MPLVPGAKRGRPKAWPTTSSTSLKKESQGGPLLVGLARSTSRPQNSDRAASTPAGKAEWPWAPVLAHAPDGGGGGPRGMESARLASETFAKPSIDSIVAWKPTRMAHRGPSPVDLMPIHAQALAMTEPARGRHLLVRNEITRPSAISFHWGGGTDRAKNVIPTAGRSVVRIHVDALYAPRPSAGGETLAYQWIECVRFFLAPRFTAAFGIWPHTQPKEHAEPAERCR